MLHQYRLDTSGSGLYLTRVARELMSRGHELSLLTHDGAPWRSIGGCGRPGDGDARGRCRTYDLRSAQTYVAYPRAEEPGSRLFRDLTDEELRSYLDHHVEAVTAAVEDGGIDVLHVNSEVPMSWVAAEVARRTGVRYVTVGHGSTLEYVVGNDARYLPLCREGLRGSSAVVALNDELARRILALVPEVAPRLVQLAVGVDCSVFRPASDAGRPPTIAYVGRLSVEKGIFHLLGALGDLGRLVPGVRVVVVGGGVDRPELEAMLAALRANDLPAAEDAVRAASDPAEAPWVDALVAHWRAHPPTALPEVHLLGHQPEDVVAAHLADADVTVVPSLVREAFPLVVLESLACGTPVMAVRAGGLAAVLDEITPALGEVGPLLPLPGSVDELVPALAPAVHRLLGWLSYDERRERVRADCRALASSRYDWSQVVDRLEALYRAAAARACTPEVEAC
jgi:glycosyltransferase involved in cell wall biosynthesis